ncbi:methyltransferase [Mangrovactinospora gilvigrisea]|uniref:Methyltransferase n=1 Tax=Mangrovactinospora gilvigrisea TaxID=1428644 RepID=A0A1J7BDG9_9ACTN|nr:class I SAM-dependent methyltransferase [Mangrovactinospora gilvigrisea]OIV36694.1 methyltransferase [Mangrovactinospora gilvigrisea]
MTSTGSPAPYDEIADWYETEFLARRTRIGLGAADGDPLEIDRALAELLGTPPSDGAACLEIGCGTGVHAERVRALGWTPIGVDLSAGMLRHSRGRLPAARADAARLPFADGSLPAVLAAMVHTDMPDYPAVVREAARVLRPGGLFVHIGVHPCFCGGFADRGDAEAVVIRPGYRDGHWTTASWSADGVRARVGATHLPLPALLAAPLAAGLALTAATEGGTPTPSMLAFAARRQSREAQ